MNWHNTNMNGKKRRINGLFKNYKNAKIGELNSSSGLKI